MMAATTTLTCRAQGKDAANGREHGVGIAPTSWPGLAWPGMAWHGIAWPQARRTKGGAGSSQRCC